ncbi:AMP-binding protein [Nocardia sp. NPDC052566]|uniref:AMP-binding protein n=1 Tax=Nocardia sp. NPDC052566 TaxID=3364330 RepID=UPI0037CC2048
MSANDTYVHQILEVLSREPGKVVLTGGGIAMTAAEFDGLVRSAAQLLHRHIAAEPAASAPVVGILTATNTPATLILRYAANLVGATVVHLHTTNAVDPNDPLPTHAAHRAVAETKVTVLAVDAGNLDRARVLGAGAAAPIRLAALGDLGPDVLDLTGGDPTFDAADIAIAPDRIAVVTYTSGTTGKPKGIAVDFRARRGFITAGLQMAWRATYLATLPMSHSSGQAADDSLASGGAVIMHDGFAPGAVLRAIEEHRITRMLISPPQLYLLMDHPDVTTTDLSSLAMLCYTGAPSSRKRLADAVRIFGQVLIQIYGTTEAAAITMLGPAEHLDPGLLGTTGRPLFAQVRIRDQEDGRDLPTGEIGEICVRSPFRMAEYVGDPELTARTVRDGWLHTGDLGFVDERGYLTIRGRMSEVVKTNGIKIYPAAVEDAFLAHPEVAQAAVFPVVDQDRIEYLHAAVVLRDPGAATEDELRTHIAAEISPKHVPARIHLRDALPLTGVGKPDKALLAKTAG